MREWPKSRAEALVYRYGSWAGTPNGYPWNKGSCAAEIWTGGRGSLPTQCSKKHGHGPDGIYCKAHSMMVAPPSSFKAWYTRKMFGYGVDEVQLVAGTEKSVTKENGTRESRDTQYGRYFATREEAVAYAVQLAENHIASAKSKIAAAEAFIESIKP